MQAINLISKFKGNAEWIEWSGHYYVAARKRGRKVSYRCGSTECGAQFIATEGVPGQLSRPHSHEPQPWLASRNQLYQNLKTRSLAEATTPLQIYEEEAARYPDAAPYLLYGAVKSSMRKWRRSSLPPVPRSVRAFGEALRGQQGSIYHATVTAADGAVAVVMAMPGWQECLRNAGTVVVDATFKCVPAGTRAAQLLTVHSIVGESIYHPVVVLMDSRRQSLYEEALGLIWHDASTEGAPPLQPQHVVTDYEPALQGALRHVTGQTVSGCYFHFLQALTRKARRFHIDVRRRDSLGLRLVRLYGTIALLPPVHARQALTAVEEVALAEGLPFNREFHDYFESYWMGQIGPEGFSAHRRPHRTSNAAESFHSYLSRALGSSPNVWIFVQVIQRKFATCVARRRAQLDGRPQPSHRHRARSLVRLNVTLDNVAEFERGHITMHACLSASSRAVQINRDLASEPLGIEEVPEVGIEVVVEDEIQITHDTTHHHTLPHHTPPHLTTPQLTPPPFTVPLPEPAAPRVRCGVCMENEVQRALIPCGHLLCVDCIQGIEHSDTPNTCAFCRGYIQSTLSIYF